MDMPMSMPLLPQWLRIVWALLLFVVLVQHAVHARQLRGQPRWWHIGHTMMALGMAAMYLLPRMQYGEWYRAGLVLFGVITAVEAVGVFVLLRREGVFNPLWVSSTIGMLVMTYMMISPVSRPSWLTLLFVGYLAVEVLAWALGLWERLPVLRRPATAPDSTAELAAPGAATRPSTTEAAARGRVLLPIGLPAHSTPGIRASLAIMAASMGYMLVAMIM